MESSTPCGAFAPLFSGASSTVHIIPTFTGERVYRLGLRLVRSLGLETRFPIEERAFQAGRRERGNIMSLGKERTPLARVRLAGTHQAFDMPSHLPKRLYETLTSSPTFG